MITDEQVRRIALFFLFSLMDEKIALQAAHRTVAQLKAQTSMNQPAAPSSMSDVDLIRILRKHHGHYQKLLPRNRPTGVPVGAWSLPEGLDLSAWIKFQKDALEHETVAIVLSRILGYPEETIAEGLNITLGTARYRIGKGVRQLGMVARGIKV